MDVEHISVGGIPYDISDGTMRSRKATKDILGSVMLSDSSAITEAEGLALPASEKNPLIENSLAWQIDQLSKREAQFRDTMPDAGHNAVYRGKNLTNVYSIEEICRRISDGSFDDLYVGDYFDITIHSSYTDSETVRCIIAGFNLFFYGGEQALVKNHAVIVALDEFVKDHNMNPGTTATSKGGYYYSDMFQTVLPVYADALKQVFYEHLLEYWVHASAMISMDYNSSGYPAWDGIAIAATWAQTYVSLLNEIQTVGSNVYSSSGRGSGSFQFPIFTHCPKYIIGRTKEGSRHSYWLSDVVSSSAFAVIPASGAPWAANANDSAAVRPYWLIG